MFRPGLEVGKALGGIANAAATAYTKGRSGAANAAAGKTAQGFPVQEITLEEPGMPTYAEYY